MANLARRKFSFVKSIADIIYLPIFKIIDSVFVYTYVRCLLTQDQKKLKKFVKTSLEDYKCGTIADVCCGTGDFAPLIPKDAKYIGWDSDKNYINFAKERYEDENRSFVVADVLKTKSIEDKKYDAVLLISTLHHFSDDELKKILLLAKKIMKKVVIVADIIPNPSNPLQKFFTKMDRGKFVRPAEEKINILSKYFNIEKTELISTGSVIQFCIICKNKNV